MAIAGIVLSEEVSLPRLSLMCEVAASQLVSSKTVVEALALSSTQYQRTGNKLPILRKAAMLEHVLGKGPRGVAHLYSMPSFSRGLDERRDLVVPSLLAGIREAVLATLGPHVTGGHDGGGFFGWSSSASSGHPHEHGSSRRSGKRELRNLTLKYEFEELDEKDVSHRESERRKWRAERWNKRRKILDTVSSVPVDPYGLQQSVDPPEGDMHMLDLVSPHNIDAEFDAHHRPSQRSLSSGAGFRRISHHLGGNSSWGRGGDCGYKSRGSRGGSSGSGGRSSRGSGRRRGERVLHP